MYKAFLLIPCLLVCTALVMAQERAPQYRPSSPEAQRIFDKVRAMTPEQRARLIERALASPGGRHASAQGATPIPGQHPLTPPPATSVLGGFPDFTPDPNLLKYGPFGPNVKYGPLGPIGEEQGVRQSANAGSNPGVVWNLEGFNIDKVINPSLEGINQSLGGVNERIEAGTNGAIGALNNLPQLIEAANQPPVLRPAEPAFPSLPSASVVSAQRTRNAVDVMAQAAALQKSSDSRRLDRDHLPESGRLILRSNPKGYYVGSLDVDHQNDQFLVKAKVYLKNDGDKVCWALGDTRGTVKLKDVWVECNSLKGDFSNVRLATDSEVPDSGYQSARHLEDRFASLIAPVTNPDKKGPKDAKEFAVLTQDTTLHGNYPLGQSPNSPPGQFTDDLGVVVHAARCNEFFKVRYFSNDGRAAVGKYVHVNSQTGDHVEVWGILPVANISLPLSEGKPPCKQ